MMHQFEMVIMKTRLQLLGILLLILNIAFIRVHCMCGTLSGISYSSSYW